MIARIDLKRMAKAKFKDAEILFRNRRYDSAAYLCGYSVELALKARICATLKWAEFPESQKDFEPYRSFKTHDLNTLLRLSTRQHVINTGYYSHWITIAAWSPNDRYKRVGSIGRESARAMIDSARTILGVLL
jgi:HEPN domain